MGCIPSKNAVTVTPALDSSGAPRDVSTAPGSAQCRGVVEFSEKVGTEGDRGAFEEADQAAASFSSFPLRNVRKFLEGELVAAGWPYWLSAVASEAIQGWVPLKADAYEKLEKVGQGTYSTVFRARELDTGRIVALKKVRFDNFEPESVRFMAREIQILRRLDHPNVMKLEGLIASRLSCSIYLVLEYMEHDLAGLSSSPDIKFTEPQMKCYMRQLLCGLDHCSSRGIVHRDIKCANLLVNNGGILKIADFGLANYFNPEHKQPLTSRVVTLWYRAPELLLGSTSYDTSVDLWSAGCVFAEMYRGKPILQGRTEVEQLHKIFKLCGSPSDEYWNKAKLPHATIYKPHQPYHSNLHESFNDLPENALALLEILLSVEPSRRGTASSALSVEYFKTKPYASEPSKLPKYEPSKEIDAKMREQNCRRKSSNRRYGPEEPREPSRRHRTARETDKLSRPAEVPEVLKLESVVCKDSAKKDRHNDNFDTKLSAAPLEPLVPVHCNTNSQEDAQFSGPLILTSSGSFSWSKWEKIGPSSRSSLRNYFSNHGDQERLQSKSRLDVKEQPKRPAHEYFKKSSVNDPQYPSKQWGFRRWSELERPDSSSSCDASYFQDLSNSGFCHAEATSSKNGSLDASRQDSDRLEYSGPILTQASKVDELLKKHERQIRRAVRNSWFRKLTGLKKEI